MLVKRQSPIYRINAACCYAKHNVHALSQPKSCEKPRK